MNTLLTLNIALEQEDDLIDYLLEHDDLIGFTSWPVSGHGRLGFHTLAEQVTGRRKRIRVEILLDARLVPPLLESLSARVGKGIT